MVAFAGNAMKMYTLLLAESFGRPLPIFIELLIIYDYQNKVTSQKNIPTVLTVTGILLIFALQKIVKQLLLL